MLKNDHDSMKKLGIIKLFGLVLNIVRPLSNKCTMIIGPYDPRTPAQVPLAYKQKLLVWQPGTIDAVYEDIYDFDDVKYDTQLGIVRPRELYSRELKHHKLDCQNIWGDNVHFPNIRNGKGQLPNIAYDKASLPPIPGSKGLEKIPRAKPLLDSGSDVMAKNKVVNLDVERKPYIPKHAQNMPEYANISSSLTKSTRLTPIDESTREHRAQELANHDEMYRSLMAGVPDKSLLERSPQVVEYERRNKAKRLLSRQHMPHAWDSSSHPYGDNVETTPLGEKTNHNVHRLPDINEKKSVQGYDKPIHQPLPPKAPKPANHALNENKRKYRRSNTQSVKDNQRVVHPVPRSQVARVEIDYEKEVNEALRVQRGLDLLHKEMAEKKASLGRDKKVHCPTPASAASSNVFGCSTQSHTPAVTVPCMCTEPGKSWNGDAAKRKLGFKSKGKTGNEEPTAIDVGRLPEKIRKEMKKYFH